ncbi:nuclear transport factor 2 family protein [Cloacibacillus sp. An23]|uniref:nuclear transport factor 2 family protein n=1 Tax=Cloacibacillus sp. An23 TaxID=1965591 RepID=UPI001EF70BBB|nr:nuclear transport factor 2 family protein [Cloacibacillus sp. An23]
MEDFQMRADIKEYEAVQEAAMKFVKSVAEGNSKYAKELFIDEAVLFGYLDGNLEHGSIQQFYHNVDTVPGGDNFKARVDVLLVEETLAVVRVLEQGWGNRIDFTDVLLLLKMNGEWKCVAKAYNQNSDTIKK